MLVTIAAMGCRCRNEPSDSSASATSTSPLPRRAFEPSARAWPPTITVGSSPAWPNTAAIMAVVLVLPCEPATATPSLTRISSPSISARGMTGMPRARAASSSGLSGRTALETTTTSADSTWAALWPRPMRPPRAASRRVTSPSFRSDPETLYPRFSSTSAMPDMPTPPMPTKWMATSRFRNMAGPSLRANRAGRFPGCSRRPAPPPAGRPSRSRSRRAAPRSGPPRRPPAARAGGS
jgi:hypothetical protein